MEIERYEWIYRFNESDRVTPFQFSRCIHTHGMNLLTKR